MTLLLETAAPGDPPLATGTSITGDVVTAPVACAGGIEDRVPGAQRRLAQVARGDGHGWLEWHRPAPSAAFSRRDLMAPGFAAAVASVRTRGYAPFVRPVGGRLAVYGEGSLVLDLLVREEEPREGTTARFRVVADALAVGLRRLGVGARVGGVPGEYCPGTWSVNAEGRRKLAGTGQRLAQGALLVTAVIVVRDAAPLCEAMSKAYALLGLELDPASVGAVSDDVPGVSVDDVQDVLDQALSESLGLGAPDPAGTRELLAPWRPR